MIAENSTINGYCFISNWDNMMNIQNIIFTLVVMVMITCIPSIFVLSKSNIYVYIKLWTSASCSRQNAQKQYSKSAHLNGLKCLNVCWKQINTKGFKGSMNMQVTGNNVFSSLCTGNTKCVRTPLPAAALTSCFTAFSVTPTINPPTPSPSLTSLTLPSTQPRVCHQACGSSFSFRVVSKR